MIYFFSYGAFILSAINTALIWYLLDTQKFILQHEIKEQEDKLKKIVRAKL